MRSSAHPTCSLGWTRTESPGLSNVRLQGEKALFSRMGFGDNANRTIMPTKKRGMARMISNDK